MLSAFPVEVLCELQWQYCTADSFCLPLCQDVMFSHVLKCCHAHLSIQSLCPGALPSSRFLLCCLKCQRTHRPAYCTVHLWLIETWCHLRDGMSLAWVCWWRLLENPTRTQACLQFCWWRGGLSFDREFDPEDRPCEDLSRDKTSR